MWQVSVNKVLVMLCLYSCKDALKALRDPGPLGLRQSLTITAQPRVMSLYQLLIRMHQINSHCTVSNVIFEMLFEYVIVDLSFLASTGRVPLTTVGQNASNQSIGRSPLSRIDQNANHGVLLDSTVTGVKRRGGRPSIETLFKQSKKSSTSEEAFGEAICEAVSLGFIKSGN
ncbi:hypothetical protein DCAR_0830776 [Daucus carota subsp. sativus]|uniref:Uncharacterized protein n=1 Tax=Daucus carota subsp. sativus TaxID=79200 RepID=A0A175YL90_DAUCS|nr:hypothetical protein DCAR_0830776 [Daucus carota subsp. sativus]